MSPLHCTGAVPGHNIHCDPARVQFWAPHNMKDIELRVCPGAGVQDLKGKACEERLRPAGFFSLEKAEGGPSSQPTAPSWGQQKGHS